MASNKPVRVSIAVDPKRGHWHYWVNCSTRAKLKPDYVDMPLEEFLALPAVKHGGLVTDAPIWTLHWLRTKPTGSWYYTRISRMFRGPLQPGEGMRYEDALNTLAVWARMFATKGE